MTDVIALRDHVPELAEATPPAATADLRDQAIELMRDFRWFHSIELLPGLVTPGIKSREVLDKEAEWFLGPLDLRGRSVLDIGAFNGFFSFDAKRRGAAKVTATDSFTWRHAVFRARQAFELARRCLQLEIEAREIDPTELPGDLEPADVVLFLGVFYHLFDPIAVLEKLAPLAREVLVLETHCGLVDLPGPAMRFWPRTELAGDVTNWWSPNPEALYELLRVLGFGYVCFRWYTPANGRGIIHAFRDSRVAAGMLGGSPDNVGWFELDSPQGRAAVFAPPTAAAMAPNAAVRSELMTARGEIDRLKAELRQLKASPSWRMTRPLRWMTG